MSDFDVANSGWVNFPVDLNNQSVSLRAEMIDSISVLSDGTLRAEYTLIEGHPRHYLFKYARDEVDSIHSYLLQQWENGL